MNSIDGVQTEAKRLSWRCGAAGILATSIAYFAAPYGPRLADTVGVVAEWRVWALVAAGLPFLMAASLGSRMHGFREPGLARGDRLLETHRKALGLALVGMMVGAGWVYAVGVPMNDDWLPVIVGVMAWIGQAFRFQIAMRRWKHEG